MIYKVLSLYYLHIFPPLTAVSLLLAKRLRVCVVVFIHEKENWQSVFPASCHASGVHCSMYHDRDTFDFSHGHVTKNQTMTVPV